MPDGVYYNGKFTSVPSVLATVNTTGLASPNINNPTVVAIVGQGTGGVPGVPMKFVTPTDAVTLLRGGDLLTGVLRAFNPSDANPGASQVIAVRVDPASQATATLKDSTTANSVVITATNYGATDNLISVGVSAGTVSGLKATIAYLTQSYVRDNLGDNALTIKYSGTGATTATVEVTYAEGVGTLTTAITGDAETPPLTLLLASYPTVQSLVNYINSQHGYTAVVTTNNPNEAPTLDAVTTPESIMTTAVTLTANLQAFVNGINGNQPLVTAAIASGGDLPPTTTALPVYLTGGLDVGDLHLDGTANSGFTVTTTNDWIPALNSLVNTNALPIATMSSDPTVWAALLTFINTNTSTFLPRRGYVGAALGAHTTNLTTYVADVQALNSDRIVFAPQGFSDYDDVSGLLKTYPPYIYAAVLAGLQSGQAIGNSITNLSVRGLGLEWNPTASELELAIENGICISAVNINTGTIRVVRGISTWLQDDNYYRTEVFDRDRARRGDANLGHRASVAIR